MPKPNKEGYANQGEVLFHCRKEDWANLVSIEIVAKKSPVRVAALQKNP